MTKDLTRGTPWKLIVQFALPIMAGNLLQQLYNTADTIIVGNFNGQQALSAVGACASLTVLFTALAIGFSIGAGVLISQYFGASREQELRQYAATAIVLMLAMGLLMSLIGVCSARFLLARALGTPEALLPLTLLYFRIYAAGLVFQFGYNIAAALLRALGDSKATLYFLLVSSVLNVVLDLLFVAGFHMGVAGAAAASLLGNAAGILVVLPYLLSKKRTFRFVLRADGLRETGRDLASSCSSFATDKASRIFSGLTVNLLLMYFVGNIGVALYAVYSQLRFILRILAGGALQTISTLGSMLYGERDFYGLRKMLFLLSKYTYALVAALMAGLFCFSAPFLNSYGIAAEPDTVLSLRIMLLSLPFLWLNDLLARLYPSVQRQRLSVLLLTLQNVVLKILLLLLCVAAISRLHWRSVPAVAVWCLLVELLSPAVTLLREKRTCGNVALLGLEDQADRSCHSFSITGKAENVADIHREIDLFCQQNGIPRNKGVLLAIAFEEAALNTINHNEHVSMIDICLLLEEGSLIVRIRDDGAPFDPLAFVDDEDILQMNNIRLLERLTDQKTYTRIMNMNNTVLSIRLEAAENDGANDGTC